MTDEASPSNPLGAFIDASLDQSGQGPATAADVTWPFILFRHGDRWFGVRAEAVSIVVTKESITRVPRQSEHVLGVALIRSWLVPVIDLATLLGLSTRPDPNEPGLRLVVLTSDDAEIAILVDETRGVVDLRADDIGHVGGDHRDSISGEVRWRRHMVSIIDTHGLIDAATRREGP